MDEQALRSWDVNPYNFLARESRGDLRNRQRQEVCFLPDLQFVEVLHPDSVYHCPLKPER